MNTMTQSDAATYDIRHFTTRVVQSHSK